MFIYIYTYSCMKNFLPGNDATCALGTSRIKSVYSRLIKRKNYMHSLNCNYNSRA